MTIADLPANPLFRVKGSKYPIDNYCGPELWKAMQDYTWWVDRNEQYGHQDTQNLGYVALQVLDMDSTAQTGVPQWREVCRWDGKKEA